MKSLLSRTFFCTLFSFLSCTFIFSQQGPLHWTHPIKVEANDIYLQWLQNDNGTVHSYQKIYNLKIASLYDLPQDSLVSVKLRHQDSRTGGGSFTDAASGNFTVSVHDEIVSIWKSPTGINIMMPKLDTTDGLWTNTVQDSITGNIENQRIYVRALDIDSDSLDEFIVAYVTNDDSVHFNLYNVDTTLHPTLISSFCTEKLVSALSIQYVRYFIETGDFNGDGSDELALFAVEVPPPTNSVRVKVKLYDFSGGTFIAKAQTNVDVPRLSTIEDFTMAAASGHFTNDNMDELAFSAYRSSEGVHYSYNYILKSNQNLDTLILGPRYRVTPYKDVVVFSDLALTSGDLNGDGRDEIVFADNNAFYILEPDDNLNLILKGTGGVASGGNNDYMQSNNFIKISSVNQDTTNDIVIVKNFVNNQFQNGFFVAMIQVDSSLSQTTGIGRLFGDEPGVHDYKPYSIAVGNFDGFNFTIGQPIHHTQNNVVQTLVKLNAPPIHFDVFNGQTYDVNGCYNGGNCDSYSQYVKAATTSVEVTTSVHRDWEVSAGAHVSGSVEVAPFGVGATIDYNAYFLHKWGHHFSKDSTNIKDWTNYQEITTSEDDEIYATVSDYDLWEYPFYYGNEDFPRETIMTLVPHNVRGQWFPSKSYYALSYVPDHEVGNILSYYDTLAYNSNISEPLGTNFGSDKYTLTSGTNENWSITYNDFTSVQADTTVENTNSWGVSFVVEATGDFGHTNYSTQKTSVSQSIKLNTHFGGINLGIGDVKYAVKPYAYWGDDGTLEINYAVKPELAPQGFTKTWWQNHYGQNSDPTFILPWLLDPEKGYTLDDPDKRFQTNDIILSPKNPSPGDTVTITAKVRNFSLISTPSTVTVSFYIDDPDSGGTPIIGINGTNDVSTNGVVPSRQESDVELKWILPTGLPQYPRIYAVLDKGNSISEIHENNNKGFTVLGVQNSLTGIGTSHNTRPTNYLLYQSYPNPFNPSATIKYAIPKDSKVSIKVYDILGREVTTLVNEFERAGTYKVRFDASAYASGVYFYRIRAGNFIQTKKMVLLK
ncbi:MAG: T9SS type A sorting domain-containing protein [Ignavibacteriaceae bacterium]